MDEVYGVDIEYNGNTFTWCNKRRGLANIRERLDRVMASVQWRALFTNVGVIHLNAHQSDHSPIILNLHLNHPNLPRQFHFQEIWTRGPSCANVIKEVWECINSRMDIISIGKRIITMSSSLNKWNKGNFGFYKDRILELAKKIKWLQSSQPTEEVLNDERILQEELNEWLTR